MKKPKTQIQGRWVLKWKVPSETQYGKFWTISVSSEMKWGCSCPKWIFPKPKMYDDTHHLIRWDCDHIRYIKKKIRGDQDEGMMIKFLALEVDRLQRAGYNDDQIAEYLEKVGNPIEAATK